MAEPWPGLVLIDREGAHRAQLATAARTFGIGFRALGAIPRGDDAGRGSVRVAVAALADSRTAITALRAAFPAARAIIYGGDALQRTAVEAFRAGADDFVGPGADVADLKALLSRFLPPADAARDGLIGPSAALARVRAMALRLAPVDAGVLISGETGTGKECLATILHRHSRRSAGPLVALNCAAIPDGLLEGELFGYERGAFSGAHLAFPGKLKLADGGTLLLDEVGELSLAGQAKLLRAIESGAAYRLGATRPTRFDVRVVAATNRDLPAEIAAGRFREDLFYRLAVARLELPPLRRRREDIAPIAIHLLRELACRTRKPGMRIAPAAMRLLEAHDWPGNVRELRNVVEIAMVTARDTLIEPDGLPDYLRVAAAVPRAGERECLIGALAHANGNKSDAARLLNVSRMTLYRRLARHGLSEGPLALQV